MDFPFEINQISDRDFDDSFLGHYSTHSSTHWTPIEVAKLAASWLVTSPQCKVLDVGSGVGKFCILAALSTVAHFYGVEQRSNLVSTSTKVARRLKLQNVQFIHGNFEDLNFKDFDSFYLFNPFWENITTDVLIDKKIPVSSELYNQYNTSLSAKLSTLKVGTRLATYLMRESEIPSCYTIEKSLLKGKLVFWKKSSN